MVEFGAITVLEQPSDTPVKTVTWSWAKPKQEENTSRMKHTKRIRTFNLPRPVVLPDTIPGHSVGQR